MNKYLLCQDVGQLVGDLDFFFLEKINDLQNYRGHPFLHERRNGYGQMNEEINLKQLIFFFILLLWLIACEWPKQFSVD